MNSIVVLIAGGTGSGKSTLAKKLHKLLGGNMVLISLDNYYKDQSALPKEERDKVNFDAPEAFDESLLTDVVVSLKNGISVKQPHYDFNTHTRLSKVTIVKPKPIIVVEGIMSLQFQGLREMADVRIYIDVDDDERILRRILRDLHERSRNIEEVIEQYRHTVKKMHKKYVEPSKQYADFIVQETINPNLEKIFVMLFNQMLVNRIV